MNSITTTTTDTIMDNKAKQTVNKANAPANKAKIIVKKSKLVIKKSKKSIESDKSDKSDKSEKPTDESKNAATELDNPPDIEKQDQVELYLKSLTDQEKQTLDIASSHLGTSFNIKRSIGFLNWKTKQS